MKPKKERNLKFAAGKWYVDFTFRGKRVRQFGGFTKDQARNTLTKMKAGLLDVARGFAKPVVEDVTFSKFADEFLELYSRPNKRSWARDEISLNSLKAFFKNESLQTITAEKVEAFKAARRTEVSPATVNLELACLKTMLNLAVQWGRLEANPAARVKKLKVPPFRERILSPEEARRLIDAASPELRPVLITALGTGMRRGEILGLKWTDLDFARGVIQIQTSKSGKSRKVPMSATVAAALQAVPRRGDFVFFNVETGKPIRDVKTSFHAACARAKKDPDDEKDRGIFGVRFHDLRHTFASRALELGADIMSVSKILGHSSIMMTAKYLHPTGESMRLAVSRMDEFLDPTRQKVDKPSEVVITTPQVSASRRFN